MSMLDDLTLVFVVGCQRSGTTLTGQILGAHPHAVMIDEQDGLYDFLDALFDGDPAIDAKFQRLLKKASAKYPNIKKRFRPGPDEDRLVLRDTITHLVFKAPNATYFPDKIADLPQKTAIIYPVRDPRSVVGSMAKVDFWPMIRKQSEWMQRSNAFKSRFKAEYEVLTDEAVPPHIKRAVIWRVKSDKAAFFREFAHEPYVFKYEDLVADKARICEEMSIAAGLDFAPEMVSHEKTQAGVSPDGVTRRRRAIDAKSLESWREWLSDSQARDVIEASGAAAAKFGYVQTAAPARKPVPKRDLDAPVVLVGRGGGGTRLLSELALSAGIFLGNELNVSSDSMEWVDLIYAHAIRRARYGGKAETNPQGFRTRARAILREGRDSGAWANGEPWGWKLPETMMILPDVIDAFPNAKIVHLLRHPVTSSLRRTHATSRTDSEVGRSVMVAAYKLLRGGARQIEQDPDFMHNATTWRFQVQRAVSLGRKSLPKDRYLEVYYEDLCERPQVVITKLSRFLGIPAKDFVPPSIDPDRKRSFEPGDPRISTVWEFCEPVAKHLGYGLDDTGMPTILRNAKNPPT